jgi:hypothetical protein
MALFRNLGVNLRIACATHQMHASAQSPDFLDFAKNASFLNWKLTHVPTMTILIYGWALVSGRVYLILKKPGPLSPDSSPATPFTPH